jgi:hypothetical protein
MTTYTMGSAWAIALLGLVLAGGTAERAHADPGTLTIGGTMDGTVDGSAFTAAPFTAVATFLWSEDMIPAAVPVASFPTSLSFDIGGEGTFTTAPGAEIFAVLYQPPVFGTYGVELQYSPDPSTSSAVSAFFATETWDALTQTFTLSDLTDTANNAPFSLPLADGGTLQIDNFDSVNPTATVFASEPGSLGLVGLGLTATGLFRRRRSAV